ncbi:hypothetical protein CMV_000362 [Castanea mollissima]|uniref:Aminotransferase class I/classII large domain-containing protein n=1 Tax=Castanea mollissima TaxID=60419 RepID=A0A8J4S3R8_9ROSI|nr:hypothetical protein CMV_000362 [Castanea mollissima]
MNLWDSLVEEALAKLESLKLVRHLRPIHLPNDQQPKPIENEPQSNSISDQEEAGEKVFQMFDEMQQWERSFVEVHIAEETFQSWISEISTTGEEVTAHEEESHPQQFKKLILFSRNDYLGLSSHLAVKRAAVKKNDEVLFKIFAIGLPPLPNRVCSQHGLVGIHRKYCLPQDCRSKPSEEDRIAIFSDALNHASIIDAYSTQDSLLQCILCFDRLKCKMKKKVVVTDGLFSMDGDFAPMVEIVKLRKKHQFLLVVDDAHGTFVCGKNGGGVAEEFNCEEEVDICIGTLSKTTGCYGGFIACSCCYCGKKGNMA